MIFLCFISFAAIGVAEFLLTKVLTVSVVSQKANAAKIILSTASKLALYAVVVLLALHLDKWRLVSSAVGFAVGMTVSAIVNYFIGAAGSRGKK